MQWFREQSPLDEEGGDGQGSQVYGVVWGVWGPHRALHIYAFLHKTGATSETASNIRNATGVTRARRGEKKAVDYSNKNEAKTTIFSSKDMACYAPKERNTYHLAASHI